LEFRILGPLAATDGVRELTPPRPKSRALLALLLLRAGQVVSPDEALNALWGERPPPAARNALQGHVAALRKLLGSDRIETRGGGYALQLEEDELDLHRFEQLLTDAQDRDPLEKAEALAHALALFRGAPLEDFRYDSFASGEAARIEELRLFALEEWMDAQLALGRHARLVSRLDQLVSEEPLRERLRGQQMLALYRSGRQAEALEAYRRARHTFRDELGVDPGPALQRLHREILNQDPELEPPEAVPEPSGRIPTPPTPMIGRARELAEAHDLLLRPDVRLVTLTGPGGIGKTRIALEVARAALHHFPEGTFFVPLAALAGPTFVLPTIAQAIGVEASTPPALEQALARFAAREALIVLDNFEHLIAAAPELGRALGAGPALKLLVTSRQALRLDGEHLYRVPALDADPATALFLDRAQAVRLDLARGEETVTTVAEICRRLDYLPLAIELAAARTPLFSPQDLLARIGERFELLTGASRHHPARQQTLRRTLEWSYDLLDSGEKRLLSRLAVFAGGWTVDAASDVCGEGDEVIDRLSSLVDKSLLYVDPAEVEPRQGMLDTIHAFAAERLAESDEAAELQRHHAAYFLKLAEEAEANWRGSDQERLERLEREHDNLRAALAWSVDSDPDGALRLVAALSDFWIARGHLQEGRRLLDRALGAVSGRTATRAKALLGSCGLDFRAGSNVAAAALAEESLTIYREVGEGDGAGRSLHLLGVLAWVRGETSRSARLLDESLAVAGEGGFEAIRASALHSLGILRWFQGDDRAADSLIRQSLAVLRDVGTSERSMTSPTNLVVMTAPWPERDGVRVVIEDTIVMFRTITPAAAVGYALGNLGNLARAAGDAGLAEALLRESVCAFEAIGDDVGRAQELGLLGNLAAAERDSRAAAELLAESLEIRRRIGETRAIGNVLGVLGNLAVAQGDHETAAALLAESQAVWEETGDRPAKSTNLTNLGNLAVATGELERAVSLWEEAIELLRACQQERWIPWHLVDLGQIFGFLGDADRARNVVNEALDEFRRMSEGRGVDHALEALGLLDTEQP
jgi:predicted ATPase/DNA-binding SARP family transcriptional activator